MPNCKLRPVCVTSVPETWRNSYVVGPELRMDTAPSLFRWVHIAATALFTFHGTDILIQNSLCFCSLLLFLTLK